MPMLCVSRPGFQPAHRAQGCPETHLYKHLYGHSSYTWCVFLTAGCKHEHLKACDENADHSCGCRPAGPSTLLGVHQLIRPEDVGIGWVEGKRVALTISPDYLLLCPDALHRSSLRSMTRHSIHPRVFRQSIQPWAAGLTSRMRSRWVHPGRATAPLRFTFAAPAHAQRIL